MASKALGIQVNTTAQNKTSLDDDCNVTDSDTDSDVTDAALEAWLQHRMKQAAQSDIVSDEPAC